LTFEDLRLDILQYLHLCDTEDDPKAHRDPQTWFLLNWCQCSLDEGEQHVESHREGQSPIKFEILRRFVKLDATSEPRVLTSTITFLQTFVSSLHLGLDFSLIKLDKGSID
jgi:hypothetical protein